MTSSISVAGLDAAFLRAKFAVALEYEAYLATDPARAERWIEFARNVRLRDEQRRLLQSFTREMNVIVSSGLWCGDCVAQGPMLAAIAEANPLVRMRWVDRDEHRDLAERITINQGMRVPTVVFMAEDFEPVGIFGDRTLTRYRAIAAKQLGAHCPLPGAPVPQDELDATVQEWLNEFERIHLLLRTSARLRERHGD